MENCFIKLSDEKFINLSCIESFGVDYIRVDNTNRVYNRKVLKIRTKSGDIFIIENFDFINEILKNIKIK